MSKEQTPKQDGTKKDGEDIQALLDRLVFSEGGAELVMDGDEEKGAIAAAAYSPERHEVTIKLLSPPASMFFERPYSFTISQHTDQPEKERIAFRSTGDHIYVVQSIRTDYGRTSLAKFEMPDDAQQKLRKQLLESLIY